mgnify:CR=1 FL=1
MKPLTRKDAEPIALHERGWTSAYAPEVLARKLAHLPDPEARRGLLAAPLGAAEARASWARTLCSS